MEKELRELGLSYYESKAFELLLKDKFTMKELSKKSRIPFGKIYSVLKNLKDKNLIKETNSRPKLVYIENASEVLSNLIKTKQEKDRAINEKIRNIAIEIDTKKRKTTKFFQIGTTINDNKIIQLRSFHEAENEILQILNIHHKPKSNRTGKTIWEKAIVDAVHRGVVFKSIYPKNIILPKILMQLNKKHPDKFQIKRINTDFVRCDIIDGKKVLIKLVQQDPLQSGGVIFIENEKLAENLKKIFYELWE